MLQIIKYKVDLSDINQYPNLLRKALKASTLEAMKVALLFLRDKVKDAVPVVYGNLQRAVKTRITSTFGVHVGEVYIAKRSGRPGRTTTDIYSNYLEDGTGNYKGLPPIWPLRLWIVRKFGTRGKKAWRRVKGLQKKIAANGTEPRNIFSRVRDENIVTVNQIYKRVYDRIFKGIFYGS